MTIGGKKAMIELFAEDDAADPKQGTAAAQKLVDSKVNGVIGHLNSGTSIPASKLAAGTIADGQVICAQSGGIGRYVWNTDPTDRDPRSDPRRPPPKTPDRIYVPNKDLGSHRAAGDAAGSPTAVATMTGGPTPSNGQESFNVMAANSAWGSKEEAADCLRALQTLSDARPG